MTREITETARTLLAQEMRQARESTNNPIVREAMAQEQDRIMKRWWPKDYQ